MAGYSLIELIIVLVILAITATAIFSGMITGLSGTANIINEDMAINLAQSRTAFILGQFEHNGFASLADPCALTPSLAICSVPAGFTVTSNITPSWNGNVNHKLIMVTVSGLGSATLTSLVSNYQ